MNIRSTWYVKQIATLHLRNYELEEKLKEKESEIKHLESAVESQNVLIVNMSKQLGTFHYDKGKSE